MKQAEKERIRKVIKWLSVLLTGTLSFVLGTLSSQIFPVIYSAVLDKVAVQTLLIMLIACLVMIGLLIAFCFFLYKDKINEIKILSDKIADLEDKLRKKLDLINA